MWMRIGIVVGLLVAAFAAPAAAVEPPADLLPGSSRQPAFHRSQRSGAVLGRLLIPAIGVDETVRAGVDLSIIDLGPAHWVGTSPPGGPGNAVLAGHRTTGTAPFRDLDRLEVGDLVIFRREGRPDALYRVSETFVVDPDDVWITYEFGRPLLTMFACHPKGSARYRIVVQAELVGVGRIA
ncbi:MAG TPA: class E sortase [Actinobacteria bacterium]|nr:class E sortase [Actinomycetota bacterium]